MISTELYIHMCIICICIYVFIDVIWTSLYLNTFIILKRSFVLGALFSLYVPYNVLNYICLFYLYLSKL